jgi:hypothetical protein
VQLQLHKLHDAFRLFQPIQVGHQSQTQALGFPLVGLLTAWQPSPQIEFLPASLHTKTTALLGQGRIGGRDRGVEVHDPVKTASP